MLRYRETPYFGLAGSPTVREGQEQRITLDERWKTELSLPRRLAFAATGGWVNRRYGYSAFRR